MNKNEIFPFWSQKTYQLTRMKDGIFKGRVDLQNFQEVPATKYFM